jgi:hypothetical protein
VPRSRRHAAEQVPRCGQCPAGPGMVMLPLLPLLVLLLPDGAMGCNNRVIVLHPGPDGILHRGHVGDCRNGCKDQDDTGDPITLPPTEAPTTEDPTTPNSTAPIPQGDCECGQGIQWEEHKNEDGTKQLNRPWMVHFRCRVVQNGAEWCRVVQWCVAGSSWRTRNTLPAAGASSTGVGSSRPPTASACSMRCFSPAVQ